jgi:type I restriction-modification system DNA methylase subunit
MITGTLRSTVDRLWEAFWTGGVSNPLTVIEQITYLLFLRRLDENQTLKEKTEPPSSVAPSRTRSTRKKYEDLRWSSFKDKDPDTMFALFTRPDAKRDNLTVFDFMKQLGAEGSVFSQHMKGATFMIPTPRLLDRAVQMIAAIDMADRDTKGDLYEYLLSKIATAGQNGQFRTPRHIIRMMVQLMKPTPEDRICDPSAGTGGFLVMASEELRRTHPDKFHEKAFQKHWNSDLFNGVEFDPSMLRIGAMNLMLHGIEHPNLIGHRRLSKESGHIKDVYSLVLANPPFKGSLDHDTVDPAILRTVSSKKTELLFLGLILRMLKPRWPGSGDRARWGALRQQQGAQTTAAGTDRTPAVASGDQHARRGVQALCGGEHGGAHLHAHRQRRHRQGVVLRHAGRWLHAGRQAYAAAHRGTGRGAVHGARPSRRRSCTRRATSPTSWPATGTRRGEACPHGPELPGAVQPN